jgi:hypothetical protein
MNTCTKASASKEQEIEERYIKNLAASMQRTRDMLARELFTSRPKRLKETNRYIHGALNAIHKITKTV